MKYCLTNNGIFILNGTQLKKEYLNTCKKLGHRATPVSERSYCGSFVFEGDSLIYANFPGGYFDGEGLPHYSHTDFQGNITMVTDRDGQICQHTGYYPYGEPWREPAGQPYLYGGKERMRDGSLNDYDFSARRLNSALALWTAPDPMARDFSNINPYVYCASNPIRYTDPSGCELNICGNDSLTFINGIQNMLSSISISIGTNGSVSYSKIGNKKANKYDQKLMEIIDNNKVIVNIKAQKEDNISDNEYMVGGAFMGNSYNSELDNVTALQVVNPAFLNSLSKANNKKAGYDMFHELDEAFQGGLISLASKSPSPQAGIEGSVYLEAHNNAMPQSSMVYIFDFAPGINTIGLNNTELGIPIIVDDDKNRHMKPMRWKTIWRTESGKEIKRKIWDRRGF